MDNVEALLKDASHWKFHFLSAGRRLLKSKKRASCFNDGQDIIKFIIRVPEMPLFRHKLFGWFSNDETQISNYRVLQKTVGWRLARLMRCVSGHPVHHVNA